MAGCFMRCCCGILRIFHNCLILLVGSGNFVSFIAMIVAAVATRWTRLRLEGNVDDLLSGVVWYGLLYAEADVQNLDDITISEFYDDPEIQVDVVRVFVALMLIFQIAFFVVLLPTEGCVGCCKWIEKISEPLAVVLGILATASGAVAVLVWYFMTRNSEEDLIGSATFDDLIVPLETTSSDFDFGWAFWIAVGAVALELLATIFVFGTCCFCCNPPKEEEVKEDVEAPPAPEPEDEDEEAEAEHEEEDLVEEDVEEEVEMEEEEEEEEVDDDEYVEEADEEEYQDEAVEETYEEEADDAEAAAEEVPAEEEPAEDVAAEEPAGPDETAPEESVPLDPAPEAVPLEEGATEAVEAQVPTVSEASTSEPVPGKV